MDVREALLRHWPLKLAARARAILLWAGVASQEVTSQLVAVRLELDYADTLDVTRPLPTVTALVSGPGREILKLYSTPLVFHSAIPASAVQRPWRLRLTPERLEVPPSAKITVEDVQPRDLFVSLARVPQ